MSDLISRSVAIEKFNKNSIFRYTTNVEGKNVLEIIQEIPTAFDLESAIKKINKESFWVNEYLIQNYNADCKGLDLWIRTDLAIEIIKSFINNKNGGVN